MDDGSFHTFQRIEKLIHTEMAWFKMMSTLEDPKMTCSLSMSIIIFFHGQLPQNFGYEPSHSTFYLGSKSHAPCNHCHVGNYSVHLAVTLDVTFPVMKQYVYSMDIDPC